MSFFGRAAVFVAIAAGVAHVFKKDLKRIIGAVRKPAENFVKDVKKELDAAPKAIESSGGNTIHRPLATPPKEAQVPAQPPKPEPFGSPQKQDASSSSSSATNTKDQQLR